MINLTQFIGKKVKTADIFSVHKEKDKKQQIATRLNQDKRFEKKQQYQNISQKSIGLSTLLDLQNEEQAFGEFNISRIGGRSSNLKYSRKQSNLSNTINVKSEIEQMRQRRKALEQKVNKTLRKEQYRSKAFNIIDSKSQNQNTSQRKSSKISQVESNIQESRLSAEPSIVVEQQELSSQSRSSLRQDLSHVDSSNKNNSKYQLPSYFDNHYESIRMSTKSVNKHSDAFMKYLQNDMYLLKCQKFTNFIHRFQDRFLLRNIKQYVQVEDIVKRQQLKLCRFVFISWKRESKQCLQKMAMIQMIRKRVQQKRIKQSVIEQIPNQRKIIPKQTVDTSVSKRPIPQKQQAPSKDIDQQKMTIRQKDQSQMANKQISLIHIQNSEQRQSLQIPAKKSYMEADSIIEYYSELNIQQVSPIKVRIGKQDQIYSQNQTSFYSKYSCYTQKQDLCEEEDYIK